MTQTHSTYDISEAAAEKLEPTQQFLIAVGTYDSYDAAQADYNHITQMENAGELPEISVALVEKSETGHLKLKQSTFAGKAGALFGMCAGAAVAVLFPPAGVAILASTLGAGAALGVTGGLMGHFAGGVSRHALRDLGRNLDAGEASIVLVLSEVKWDGTLLSEAKLVQKTALDAHDVAQASHEAEAYLAR